jgi:hypothetical protein
MATTLASMAAVVKTALVGRSDIDSLIDDWLNASQLRFATRLRIRELEAVANLTTVIAPVTDIYAVPDDMWAPMYMLYPSDAQEIELETLDQVLEVPATPVGRPTEYTVRGTTFVFRPAHAAVETIELTYKIKVPTMTASVDMTLPDEFKEAIEFDSIAKALFISEQSEDRAKFFIEQRNDILRSLGDQRGEEYRASLQGLEVKVDAHGGFGGVQI